MVDFGFKAAQRFALVNLTGTTDARTGCLVMLAPLGDPAWHAAKSEHDGKHVGGDVERLVDKA